MAYFPMFIDLKGVPCLVVGGGSIALRKVSVLLDFGAAITVVAEEIRQEIQAMCGVRCKIREFAREDLEGMRLVVTATDDEGINHTVSRLCREKGILVNAVDQPGDCDFIFPSYIKRNEVVAAFSSGGQSPVITQYIRKQTESVVTELLGEIADCLGSLRENIKQQIPDPGQRRELYQHILQLGLDRGRVPDETEIWKSVKEMEQSESNETFENE